MAEITDPQEKIKLITQNLEEVLDRQIIEDVILNQKRPLVVYWGTAPTGKPHAAYFVPMLKVAELLRAGCTVKILLADIHAFLDNLKAPIELVNARSQYYLHTVTAILRALNVPVERLEFVLGSTYQRSEAYTMDLYKMLTMVTPRDAKRAGAEVVKQDEHAPMSSLVYPLMQALDEQHLACDAELGGTDQRKIFILAKENLTKLGYKTRAHLMTFMVPGIQGAKMSASDPDSKIDLLDPPDAVKRKLKKAYAVPRTTDNNGLLAFVQFVLLPASALKHGSARFPVPRREDEGGDIVYESIEKLREDYAADVLTPQLLKAGITDALNELLAPIQAEFQGSDAWKRLAEEAYPPPVKKEKKVKNKGTRHPGAAGAGAPAGAAAADAAPVAGDLTAETEKTQAEMEKLGVGDGIAK